MARPVKRRGIACPHCGEAAVIYTSRALSPIAWEKYHQCTNLECGHQFVSQTGIVRTIVPSQMPKAEVSIPLVARRDNDIVVTRAVTHDNAEAPLPAPLRDGAGARPVASTN